MAKLHYASPLAITWPFPHAITMKFIMQGSTKLTGGGAIMVEVEGK